jgi:quercetin dioxygenase-like cupin family protein
MGGRRTPGAGTPPARHELERRLAEDGVEGIRWWSNGPGHAFGWHDHPFHKALYCAEGTITFHLRDGDLELTAGDRLDLDPGTEHAATVGGAGVTCVEGPGPA